MREWHLVSLLVSTLLVGTLEGTAQASPGRAKASHGEAWTVFGKTYCVGATARPWACDVHYDAPRNVFWMGRVTFCVGDAPGVLCDVELPPSPAASRDDARDKAKVDGWLHALFHLYDKPVAQKHGV